MSTSTSRHLRRSLSFRDLDDAVRDAESLLESGYDRAGNWSLAQTCSHLTQWMRFPLDGFPRLPVFVRPLLWILKQSVGKRQLRKVLASGTMPAGAPTVRATVPTSDGDDAAAVDEFRQTVARFKAHTGPLHASPLFGELDHAKATQLQLIHCAHHLSFLIPRERDRRN